MTDNVSKLVTALDKYLRPQTFPIGVKLLNNEKEIPNGLPRATAALEHRVALCQGFGFARRNKIANKSTSPKSVISCRAFFSLSWSL